LNPYFWFFAIYAVLITPFTIHGSVRLEKTLRWKIQLRLAGLPLLHTGKGGEAQKTADVLASADVRLLTGDCHAHNDFDFPERVTIRPHSAVLSADGFTVKIPPCSVVLLTLR